MDISTDSTILVVGHSGLVGSAVTRALRRHGYLNLLLRDVTDVDLADQPATHELFAGERPDAVILAAARVGGILANWRTALRVHPGEPRHRAERRSMRHSAPTWNDCSSSVARASTRSSRRSR